MFPNHCRNLVPHTGLKASKSDQYAFDSLGVEIMKSARYVYTITGDNDRFTATAAAEKLDDDPAIDKWQIDQSGELICLSDDSIKR